MRYLEHSGVSVCPEKGMYKVPVSRHMHSKLSEIFPGTPCEPASDNKFLMTLNYGLSTCIKLAQAGYDVAGMEPFWDNRKPELLEGEFEPMIHQLYTASFMLSHPRSYILNEMRTGKTGATVLACNYLKDCGVPGATLVVAPLSTLWGVWEKAFKSTRPSLVIKVIHGTKAEREDLIAQDADVYLINYDGIKLVQKALKEKLTNGAIQKVVLDELTHYGDMSTTRTKIMMSILQNYKGYLWGMTGSPAGNPARVYGMASIVTPTTLPCTRQTTWNDMVYYKPSWAKEVWQKKIAPTAGDLIYKTMSPHVRFEAADVLPCMPEIVKQQRTCLMTAEQARLYKALKQDAAMILKLTPTTEKTIIVEQKVTLLHKLFQMMTGAVKDGDKSHIVDSKSRTDTICEIINESKNKTIIFGVYKGSNRALCAQLNERKISADLIDGDVSAAARTKILDRFQNTPNPRVLVAHPQTIAYGTELAAADTMIINGPLRTGAFQMSQMLKRMSSIRQKSSVLSIIELAACKEEVAAFNKDMDGVFTASAIDSLFNLLSE